MFVALLPTQFGKHFFFQFSYLSGVRIDYLAPTIYLTDLLVFALLFLNVKAILAFFKNKFVISSLLLLLIPVFFAQIPQVAAYRFIKLIELLIVFSVFKNTLFREKLVLSALFVGTIFETILSVLQFVQKHSLQGLFYFFGERQLTLSMPDIAKASLSGVEFLRPYGTFSHPNSMAGFYLLVFVFVLLNKKVRPYPFFRYATLLCSAVLLFLSFSKVAVFVFLLLLAIVFFAKLRDLDCLPCTLARVLVLIVVSALIFTAQTDPESFQKRFVLFQNALVIVQQYPITGVGLGNYVVAQNNFTHPILSFLPQPVHNIFLLILAETGIVVWGVVLFFLGRIVWQMRKNKEVLLAVLVIVLTGMADHYWLTLQQNFLLLGMVFGLLLNRRERRY